MKDKEKEMEEEPIIRLPLYTRIDNRSIEGSILIFDDYVEIRKAIRPNKKYRWNEIEKFDIDFQITVGHNYKQHNGLATAANIINILDYTHTGHSIGYQHEGYITESAYIMFYQETIKITLAEKHIEDDSISQGQKDTLRFDYYRTNDDGDKEFDKETRRRVDEIRELKQIVDEKMDDKKKREFEAWHKENVKNKSDFDNETKENGFDKWCEDILKEDDDKKPQRASADKDKKEK